MIDEASMLQDINVDFWQRHQMANEGLLFSRSCVGPRYLVRNTNDGWDFVAQSLGRKLVQHRLAFRHLSNNVEYDVVVVATLAQSHFK
jgi:hypothetical protein